LAITAGYNKLPYWQVLKDIARQGTKESRDFMASHGMIADSISDNLNRWSGDHIGVDWAGKMSNAVMRASLLNAWTDGLRQGFTMTMNASVAKMAKTEWDALNAFDRGRLEKAGINEADWGVVRQSTPTLYKGRELLSAQDIADRSVAAKVFGFINDEAEFAVINPDLTSRAFTTMGTQSGTNMGELVRTVMQFKSFPAAMITRHWRRIAELDSVDGAPAMANRVVYGTALMVTLMGLGAVATQAKQMLQGKDPIDMTPDDGPGTKFWFKALAQGGGLSILGDLFLTDPAATMGDQAGNLAKNLLGPTVGSASDLVLKNISGNIWDAARGKDTHWEADLANWAKSNTPGASLWWIRPVLDRAIMDQFNEAMSPGYLGKMKARAMREWGQRYYWEPGQMTPSRAPDPAAVAQ
jgi:hypothetical protein